MKYLRKLSKGVVSAVPVMGAAVLFVTTAQAAHVDLITGNSGSINGATFVWLDVQPTGTGYIDPFLRIQSNGNEQGYNTSGTTATGPFDNKQGIWTHDLLLANLSVVNYNGTPSYVFYLDVNEDSGGMNPPHSFISLEELQIYRTSTPSQTTESLDGPLTSNLQLANSTLVYNMDAGVGGELVGVNGVDLDYARNSGSGSGDMAVYIPKSLFDNAGGGNYVVLYSKFGNPYSTSDGFEEWWALSEVPPIPEPATVFAGLFLLGGLGWIERSRIKGLFSKLTRTA